MVQYFRTLDPVADRDYSVVYFCTRYINTCLWNIVDNYKIRGFFWSAIAGKLPKKGSSCLFWLKLSETFSDPYCILVYEILLTITKYVDFFGPELLGKLFKKGSSCLFWSKLSETFSDPYFILVYEILLTITKYVDFLVRKYRGNCSRKVQVADFD